MPPANIGKDVYQVGIQSAFGTAVAATAKLAVPEVMFRQTGRRVSPRISRGLMVRNRGYEFATQRGTDWEIRDAPFFFEQFQVFLANCIKGGVSPTGADPYTWTYTRSMTADPDLDPLTLERRVGDFSTNEDVEVADCFTRELVLTYAENEDLRFSAMGFGRDNDDTSSLTGSLSLPTPEMVPSALLKLYLDTSWAGVGGTQLANQVIGMEWRIRNGLFPKMTAEGRTALDYSLALTNPEEVSMALRLTVLMDPTTFAAEKAAARAQTLRAIQAQVTGTNSRDLKLKGLFKYAVPDLLELGMEDGQHIVTLELEETTDATNLFEAVLINKTNAPDGV